MNSYVGLGLGLDISFYRKWNGLWCCSYCLHCIWFHSVNLIISRVPSYLSYYNSRPHPVPVTIILFRSIWIVVFFMLLYSFHCSCYYKIVCFWLISGNDDFVPDVLLFFWFKLLFRSAHASHSSSHSSHPWTISKSDEWFPS